MRRSTMRCPVVILAATIAAGLPQAFAAQSDLTMTVEITNARKANATLMQEYSWNSRTELLEAGQVKDTRHRARQVRAGWAPPAHPPERPERAAAVWLSAPEDRRTQERGAREISDRVAWSAGPVHVAHRGQSPRLHESGDRHGTERPGAAGNDGPERRGSRRHFYGVDRPAHAPSAPRQGSNRLTRATLWVSMPLSLHWPAGWRT